MFPWWYGPVTYTVYQNELNKVNNVSITLNTIVRMVKPTLIGTRGDWMIEKYAPLIADSTSTKRHDCKENKIYIFE